MPSAPVTPVRTADPAATPHAAAVALVRLMARQAARDLVTATQDPEESPLNAPPEPEEH